MTSQFETQFARGFARKLARQVRRRFLAVSVVAVAAMELSAQAESVVGQLSGKVLDKNGAGIKGIEVTATLEETKAEQKTQTDASGRFVFPGLRVGGPYTLKLSDGQVKTGIFVKLDQTVTADFKAGEAEAKPSAVEQMQVVGQRVGADLFVSDFMGARTNVAQEQIETMPTVNRTIYDVAKLDPRISQNKGSGGYSGGGSNARYNNFRIDGIPAKDLFGLNASGLPSLFQPISIYWVKEFNVDVSSFDTTQKDFVGANINAVTKAGTNEYRGSAYGFYTYNRLMQTDSQGFLFNGYNDQLTAGGYVGGPILADKLFFFGGYERYNRSQPGSITCPSGGSCGNVVNVTQAEIDQILTIASAKGLTNLNGQTSGANNYDDKFFGKLSWTINNNHNVDFVFNRTAGRSLALSTSTNIIQLDSNFYDNNTTYQSFGLTGNSRWSDAFSTEQYVSYSQYSALPTSRSSFPQVQVSVRPGANVLFGQDRSRQFNKLKVDTTTGFLAGKYFLGDHTLKAGLDYQLMSAYNGFLQDYIGSYTFNSIANFTAGTYATYRLQRAANGDIESTVANWGLSTPSAFLQDNWEILPNLNLVYGLRADLVGLSKKPQSNAAALAAFGYDTGGAPDGVLILQPRFGFNYQPDVGRSLQIRGGIGIFKGSTPGVWYSNNFSNTGNLVTSYLQQNGSGATYDPNNPLVPATSNPAQLINFFDPKFQQPTVWKANLGLEHELPWIGTVASLEALVGKTINDVMFSHLNLGQPTSNLPDGRLAYWKTMNPTAFVSGTSQLTPGQAANRNTNFTDVILFKNTDQGNTINLTGSLLKEKKGDYMARVGYNYGIANDVSPGLSSVALSNWQTRDVFNPNEEEMNTSNWQTTHRIIGALSKTFFGMTTVSLTYEGKSGTPYAYVFSGDANGDGTSSNDLFYVPNGDVAYSSNSSAAAIAAFTSFINSDPYLSANKGKTARRNGAFSPWVHQFDMRVSQKFPIFWKVKGEFFFDFLNLTNLLDKTWGNIFSGDIAVARFAGVNTSKQFVYDVSSYATATPAQTKQNTNGESGWSMQLGMKLDL